MVEGHSSTWNNVGRESSELNGRRRDRQRGEKGGVKCGFRRRNAVTRRAKIRGGIVSNEKKVGVGI